MPYTTNTFGAPNLNGVNGTQYARSRPSPTTMGAPKSYAALDANGQGLGTGFDMGNIPLGQAPPPSFGGTSPNQTSGTPASNAGAGGAFNPALGMSGGGAPDGWNAANDPMGNQIPAGAFGASVTNPPYFPGAGGQAQQVGTYQGTPIFNSPQGPSAYAGSVPGPRIPPPVGQVGVDAQGRRVPIGGGYGMSGAQPSLKSLGTENSELGTLEEPWNNPWSDPRLRATPAPSGFAPASAELQQLADWFRQKYGYPLNF